MTKFAVMVLSRNGIALGGQSWRATFCAVTVAGFEEFEEAAEFLNNQTEKQRHNPKVGGYWLAKYDSHRWNVPYHIAANRLILR